MEVGSSGGWSGSSENKNNESNKGKSRFTDDSDGRTRCCTQKSSHEMLYDVVEVKKGRRPDDDPPTRRLAETPGTLFASEAEEGLEGIVEMLRQGSTMHTAPGVLSKLRLPIIYRKSSAASQHETLPRTQKTSSAHAPPMPPPGRSRWRGANYCLQSSNCGTIAANLNGEGPSVDFSQLSLAGPPVPRGMTEGVLDWMQGEHCGPVTIEQRLCFGPGKIHIYLMVFQ